jgi:hypothetical protein
MTDTKLSQTEEFKRLDRSGQMMVEKVEELVVAVQHKMVSATQAVKVFDSFMAGITAEYDRQSDAVKSLMKKYIDACHTGRALIVKEKNKQN